MLKKEEELTYEILQKHRREQERLIAEGKMQKPQIVYGLSSEGKAAVKSGRTLEVLIKELEQQYEKT